MLHHSVTASQPSATSLQYTNTPSNQSTHEIHRYMLQVKRSTLYHSTTVEKENAIYRWDRRPAQHRITLSTPLVPVDLTHEHISKSKKQTQPYIPKKNASWKIEQGGRRFQQLWHLFGLLYWHNLTTRAFTVVVPGSRLHRIHTLVPFLPPCRTGHAHVRHIPNDRHSMDQSKKTLVRASLKFVFGCHVQHP